MALRQGTGAGRKLTTERQNQSGDDYRKKGTCRHRCAYLCSAEEDGLCEKSPDDRFIAVRSGQGATVAEVLGHVHQRLREHFHRHAAQRAAVCWFGKAAGSEVINWGGLLVPKVPPDNAVVQFGLLLYDRKSFFFFFCKYWKTYCPGGFFLEHLSTAHSAYCLTGTPEIEAQEIFKTKGTSFIKLSYLFKLVTQSFYGLFLKYLKEISKHSHT